MELYFGLILYIFILIYILLLDYRKTKDLFSPIGFYIIMQLVREIPFMYFIIADRTIIRREAYAHYFNNFSDVYIKTIVAKTVFLLAFFAVSYFCIRGKITKEVRKLGVKQINYVMIVGAIIGIVSYAIFIQSNSGLNYISNNMSSRAQLFRGNNYIFIAFNVWLFSILMAFEKFELKKYKILGLILISIYMACMFVFGGRSQILTPVLVSSIVYNIKVKKINLFNFRIIALGLSCIIFIFSYSILRQPGAFEYYKQNPVELINDLTHEGTGLSVELSRFDRDMFIIDYFDSTNYWCLKNIIMAPVGLIPSFIYENKPPVDDGMYIWNLAIGNQVEIGEQYNNMHKNSWPLDSMSSGYANGGFIGVIIFGMIIGYIESKIYNAAIRNRCIVRSIFYAVIITAFQLNSLQIVNLFINVSPIIIITMIIKLSYKKIKI